MSMNIHERALPRRRAMAAVAAMAAAGLTAIAVPPVLAAAASVPAGDAAEAALLKGVQARLRQPDWLRGDFEQRKQVQGFKKPLVSRGDFVVARGRGILWRTRTPFASELRLTPKDLRASQGGVTTLQMDSQREPALRVVNEMMFALVGGDIATLARLFDLSGELRGRDGWHLVLVPRQPAWRQLLERVTLDGDTGVREVDLQEASGDRTHIVFQQIRESAPEGAAGLFD